MATSVASQLAKLRKEREALEKREKALQTRTHTRAHTHTHSHTHTHTHIHPHSHLAPTRPP